MTRHRVVYKSVRSLACLEVANSFCDRSLACLEVANSLTRKFNCFKIMGKYSYINTLNGCIANFQPKRLSDYKSEHFDDAAVQPENSYYDPVPKNINECMYEREKV